MRVLPGPRLEGAYLLASGRRVGFAEYGRPTGLPVFWFHGTPGSRRQVPPSARAAAQQRGLRLIALERPGIGDSTPHLSANVAAWADDVGAIAERLGVRRFACVGLSGGGPYVLACASRFPDRMVAGAVLGGVAPTRGVDAIGGGAVSLARRFAPLLELSPHLLGHGLHAFTRLLVPFKASVFDLYMALSPEGDRRLFRRPEMREMFIDDLVRGLRPQASAPVLDLVLFCRHWGFSLRDLRVPIRFWHGEADHLVPLAHGEHMAALVPHSELYVRAGEGHLGTLDAADEIFTTLLGLWPGATEIEAVAR